MCLRVFGVPFAPEGPVDASDDRPSEVDAIEKKVLYVGAVKEGLEGERVTEDIGIDEPKEVVVLVEGILDDAILEGSYSMPCLRGP